MPTCVVIQPFDGGKFDKRFDDTYRPALEKAGLDAYRVDQDSGADVPIDTIEERIREASICLADITTDNPNVWYELGYAFASGCFTIIVCSAERDGKLPFDIQHRSVIKYKSDSKTDFEELGKKITERAKNLLEKSKFKRFAASEQLAPREGVSQIEIQALAAIASATGVPGNATSVRSLRTSLDQSLTRTGSSLAFRRLQKRDFVEFGSNADYRGEPYPAVVLTERGWDWIDDNESLFYTHKGESDPGDADDDVSPLPTDDDVPS